MIRFFSTCFQSKPIPIPPKTAGNHPDNFQPPFFPAAACPPPVLISPTPKKKIPRQRRRCPGGRKRNDTSPHDLFSSSQPSPGQCSCPHPAAPPFPIRWAKGISSIEAARKNPLCIVRFFAAIKSVPVPVHPGHLR